MLERGWDELDFVYVSGDAYVDHPSFGMAIITRLLEAHGYRVGVIAQPDWRDPASVTTLGEPRLGFLVSAGNMDSMVNHFTVAKKRRRSDAYSPGGKAGLRPDHACVVYGNLIRRTYKKTPVILGGIEASLRRLAHYDYWSDSLKRSILLDSGADLISYGMGERSIIEIADALASGLSVHDLSFIDGTVYKARSLDHLPDDAVVLPGFEAMQSDSRKYATSFAIQHENLDPFSAHILVEEYPHDVFVVQNPPSKPLSMSEMDAVYALPFARDAHPSYAQAGGVPALSEVRFSLTSNRGCMGDCSFCALNFHQGRIIQARSHESLLAEAKLMTEDPAFKGYIHDVGGPTANFRVPACAKQLKHGACIDRRCLSPTPCPSLRVTHDDYLALLRKLRALPGVKKVFIRSGLRFDYMLLDDDPSFMRELVRHHVSGQLRVAPEHASDAVLDVMGKPPIGVFKRFDAEFKRLNKKYGLKQYLVAYLMSSHPGATLADAVELAEFVRDMGYNPEQVQDFYPTPSTISTCMYYTGLDPRTMQPVYVAKTPHEKDMQRALLQWRRPDKRRLVIQALHEAGREDLIGFGKDCLVRPMTDRRKPARPAEPQPPQRKYGKVYGGGKKPASARAAQSGRAGKSAKSGKPGRPGTSAKPGAPRSGGRGTQPPRGKGGRR